MEEREVKNIGVKQVQQMLDGLENQMRQMQASVDKLRQYIAYISSPDGESVDGSVKDVIVDYLRSRGLYSKNSFLEWKEREVVNNRQICQVLNNKCDMKLNSSTLNAYIDHIYGNGGVV